MTSRQKLMAMHQNLCQTARELMIKKNEDYATDANPFANFDRVSHMGSCSTFEGFLVRMTDKLSRLSSYAKRGTFSVADEQLKDTCIDLINYTILLYAWELAQADDS